MKNGIWKMPTALLIAVLFLGLVSCAPSGSYDGHTDTEISNSVSEGSVVESVENLEEVAAELHISNVVCPEFLLAGKFILPIEQQIAIPTGYVGITTAEEFCKIALNPTGNYILMGDIDLSGSDFDPISEFTGILNGNGYCITKNNWKELFSSVIDGGRIENLGVYISGSYELEKYTEIGGIVWLLNGGVIDNCFFDGDVTLLVRKELYPQYSGPPCVGGLVFSAKSSEISNSYNMCNISLSSGNIGGIAYGIHSTQINNCYNEGDLKTDGGRIGGISALTGWTHNGKIEADSASSSIYDCCNKGTLQSPGNVSGIVGGDGRWFLAAASVHRCFNAGDLTSSNKCFGIGDASEIYDCYNLGTLTGTEVYGIGSSTDDVGTVHSSYNVGNLIGEEIGAISPDSHSSSSPITLEYCYFLDNAVEATPKGALFANVQELSSTDMQSSKSFAGFDFDSTWRMGDTDYLYPVFRSQREK